MRFVDANVLLRSRGRDPQRLLPRRHQVGAHVVRAVVCRTVCRVGERGRVAVVLANHAVGEHHQQTASFDGSYGSPLRLQAMLVRSDYYWLP